MLTNYFCAGLTWLIYQRSEVSRHWSLHDHKSQILCKGLLEDVLVVVVEEVVEAVEDPVPPANMFIPRPMLGMPIVWYKSGAARWSRWSPSWIWLMAARASGLVISPWNNEDTSSAYYAVNTSMATPNGSCTNLMEPWLVSRQFQGKSRNKQHQIL